MLFACKELSLSKLRFLDPFHILKKRISKWQLNQLETVGWAESSGKSQHMFTSVIYSKITNKCPNKCQVATVKIFNLKFLLRTLGQFWLADKNEVVFQKASTYLKIGHLLFFYGFQVNFAKCVICLRNICR